MLYALTALSLLFSAIALAVALWALRGAPRGLLDSALIEIADQRAILDKLLTRNHATARQENVAKARDVRTENLSKSRTVVQEAQDVLNGTTATPQLLRPVKPASEDQLLMDLRRKAGIL